MVRTVVMSVVQGVHETECLNGDEYWMSTLPRDVSNSNYIPFLGTVTETSKSGVEVAIMPIPWNVFSQSNVLKLWSTLSAIHSRNLCGLTWDCRRRNGGSIGFIFLDLILWTAKPKTVQCINKEPRPKIMTKTSLNKTSVWKYLFKKRSYTTWQEVNVHVRWWNVSKRWI